MKIFIPGKQKNFLSLWNIVFQLINVSVCSCLGGVKVYQQLIVDKAEGIGGKITGFFSNKDSNKRERDYFITITSDGILKSDNHLLESRVKSMIPFTDQLHIVCYVEGGNFSFHISACQHEKMIINLYKDYVKAINFVVAINMALR